MHLINVNPCIKWASELGQNSLEEALWLSASKNHRLIFRKKTPSFVPENDIMPEMTSTKSLYSNKKCNYGKNSSVTNLFATLEHSD